MSLKQLVTAGSDLFFGATCAGCNCPGVGLCADCRTLLATGTVREVRRPLPDFPKTWSAWSYSGVVSKCLIAYKEHGSWWLAPTLVEALDDKATEVAGSEPLWLVPIPSSRENVWTRGQDVIRLLAGTIAARKPNIRVDTCLARNPVRDQAGLSDRDRLVNMSQGLRAIRRGRHRALLVDDIVTTGATLAIANRALTKAGYQVLGAITCAETPKYL